MGGLRTVAAPFVARYGNDLVERHLHKEQTWDCVDFWEKVTRTAWLE